MDEKACAFSPGLVEVLPDITPSGRGDPCVPPTTTLHPISYPWKSGVAVALLVLGIMSREKVEAGVPGLPDSEKKIEEIVAAALKATPKGDQNPFAQKLGFSGLPQTPSSCGTGEPTPLDSVLAQKLITRLFAAEGLKPQPTTFKENGFTATAQGYDPEKRIGFLIADYDTVANDAISLWFMHDLRVISRGEVKPGPGDEKRWPQIIDQAGEMAVKKAVLSDEQKREFEAIRKLESSQTKAQAYMAFAANLDVPKLSMADIEQAEKMAEAHQRYLAIISIVDQRFESLDWGNDGFRKLVEAMHQEEKRQKFATWEERRAWTTKQEESIKVERQREQLVKLAQSVREYIAWARRNGLQ